MVKITVRVVDAGPVGAASDSSDNETDSPGRERSPRRLGPSRPRDPGRRSVLSSAASGSPATDMPATACYMWNPGTSHEAALSRRLLEDTSVTGFDGPRLTYQQGVLCELARNVALREDCRLQSVIARSEVLPLCYDSLLPDEISARVSDRLTDSPSSGDEELSSASQDARQVLVCILQFQTAPTYRLLWTIVGEEVNHFAAQASQLLRTAGVPQSLFLVDPSPFPDAVTFVLVPDCWSSLGFALCVMLWPRHLAAPFAEVVGQHTTVNGLLQDFPRELGDSFDVLVHGPAIFADANDLFCPPNGTCVAVLPTGGQAEDLVSTNRLLSDATFEATPPDIPEPDDSAASWLILGPASEQLLMVRDASDEACQLSRTSGIPVEDMLVSKCAFPFPKGAVHGVPVSQYVSVRTVRISGLAGRGRVLFLDPRLVGLPFATSVLFGPLAACEALHACLDLDPVEGYSLHAWCNDSAAEIVFPFWPAEGDGLTLRFLSIGPARPLSPASASSSLCSEGDVDSAAPHSGAESGRSRSPRGRHSSEDAGLGGSAGNVRTCGYTGIDPGRWSPSSLQPPCCYADACSVSVQGLRRALPTPCRNLRVPDIAGDRLDIDAALDGLHLSTVLDAVVELPSDLCAAAVRVLSSTPEPTALQPVSVRLGPEPPRAISGGLVLSLADQVGPPVYDLSAQHMPLGRDLGQALALLDPWPFHLQHTIPAGLPLHAATRTALAEASHRLDSAQPALCDAVSIFTDGSFDGTISAWSVACVGTSGGHVSWLRWFNGRVCTYEEDRLWLGATKHGVHEAELTTVCFAQLWMLSACRLASCELCSDSLVTTRRARGEWKYAPSDLLAKACRSLAQATEAVRVQPWRSLRHVRAHVGHEWNELADVLAKAAVACDPQFGFHLDIGSWVRDGALESLWLILASWQETSAWPRMRGSQFVADGQTCFGSILPELFFGLPAMPAEVSCARTWRMLRLLTVNVQTLEQPVWSEGLHGDNWKPHLSGNRQVVQRGMAKINIRGNEGASAANMTVAGIPT